MLGDPAHCHLIARVPTKSTESTSTIYINAVGKNSDGGKVLVADVIPQGNHTVSTQRIMSLIRTRPGAAYSKATVDDDLRRLYETKLFRNVEARTAPAERACCPRI